MSPLNPGRSVVAISGPTPQAFESFVDLLDRSTRNDEVFGVVSVQSGGRLFRSPTGERTTCWACWGGAMLSITGLSAIYG